MSFVYFEISYFVCKVREKEKDKLNASDAVVVNIDKHFY